mmetsp:Transcript_66687/g.175514  ORF Transcript_66687/g.175514 Transcript_66687/m.175514 type:complete len:641 (+) Transcript_66687:1-1923(+)
MAEALPILEVVPSRFDFGKPEVTTVIRWLLRVVLVVFLAWLIRRKPDQDEEEDEDESTGHSDPRRTGVKSRAASTRSVSRAQPRRDPYPSDIRQRRNRHGDLGEGNFDTVTDKVSKSKELWEVRKSGEGPPQILPRRPRDPQEGPPGASFAGSAAWKDDSTGGGGNGTGMSSSLASLMASMGNGSAPSAAAAAASGPSPSAGVAAAGVGGGSAERPKMVLATRKKENTEADAREKMLHGHQRPVTSICWNRDGNLLFTCGKDKIVCVWSIPEGECLGTYEGHSGAVWACSVTSDSRWLVTCGADRLVIVWEARESRELARMELPGVVRSVEWAAGDTSRGAAFERFATCHNRFGAHPPAVTVWRFDGAFIEELVRITTLPTPASQVRWGRSDYFVTSAHENGELVFWRSDSGAEVKRLKAHDSAISKFEFSHDRELVCTASVDKSVRVWDLGKGTDWKRLYHVETDRPINDVALGPISRAAAAGPPGKRPSKCCVIAAGGQDARNVTTTSGSTDQFNTLLFKLPSKETFPGLLEADGVTKGHFGPVHTLAFSRDGSAIASGSEDGCVRIFFFEAPVVGGARGVAPSPNGTGSQGVGAPDDAAGGAAPTDASATAALAAEVVLAEAVAEEDEEAATEAASG